ncbi:MAG: tyrosine--tRNA ligase [Buchnera aphidicola (Periphyllus lyropictus)]|uniref:tyrosine--tRNA ligase n=1 Tax=Buchnera aphidicola TaxID=9 RepID=UPI001EB3AD37|nr:tyrosine--tRNA ligase [Buchnera aphidicola]NIH16715.1 tyrosine--tRNA ligase [Buchnera aphidicola (Periphyllus lyropictus)]USS94620.1 tyrosine--tRNA ligase [Buchnera aphidicola (Periphyllus lyropictus)]
MLKKNFFKKLKDRNLIFQTTNEKKINNLLKKKIFVYCGFDPTSDSLHIGHILPLLCLRRFQLQGHTPIVLIGGATSLIGDPSFKLKERKLFSQDSILKWMYKIKNQISLFLDFSNISNKAIILNNYDWFKNMNVLDFLRNVGKNFTINNMINKESVKNRFIKKKKGISFTEFSYSLLQAYDFSVLYKKFNVLLQIGGSDQWGNITSGIHLTYILHKSKVFGLTLPLLIKSDGKKFGKSESKTIWLDPKKTTPYEFYQFWINVKDTEVYDYLKYFTFLSIKDINNMKKKDFVNKTFFKSKEKLAKKITCLVHGKSNFFSSKINSKIFFSSKIKYLSENDFIQLKKNKAPFIFLKNKKYSLYKILVSSFLASSNRNAKDLINSNAISINYKKQIDIHYILKDSDKLFNKYTLLSKGKKNFLLLIWK